MKNEVEKLSIQVNENDSVTALLYVASKKNRLGTTVILGHGAGANQLSPIMGSLEHCRFFQQSSRGEPRNIKLRGLDEIGVAVEY